MASKCSDSVDSAVAFAVECFEAGGGGHVETHHSQGFSVHSLGLGNSIIRSLDDLSHVGLIEHLLCVCLPKAGDG